VSDEVIDKTAVIARLNELIARLNDAGFRANLLGGRRPGIHVLNPHATVLHDDFYVAREQDGSWWLWFSWAKPCAPLDAPDAASERIMHVLAASRVCEGS
jgi:hypothetical protein